MTGLWRQSASDIARRVKSGAISALEVTKDALSRLNQVNPAINAVATERPKQALSAANQYSDGQ